MFQDTINFYNPGVNHLNFYQIPADMKSISVKMVSGGGGGGGGSCTKWRVFNFSPVTVWGTAGGGGGGSGAYALFDLRGNTLHIEDQYASADIPLPGLYITTRLGRVGTGGPRAYNESWGSSTATATGTSGNSGGSSFIDIHNADDSVRLQFSATGGRGGTGGYCKSSATQDEKTGGSGGAAGGLSVYIEIQGHQFLNRSYSFDDTPADLWYLPNRSQQKTYSQGGNGTTANNQSDYGSAGTNTYATNGGRGGYGTYDGQEDGSSGGSPYIEITINRRPIRYFHGSNIGFGTFKARVNNQWVEIKNVKAYYNNAWHSAGGAEQHITDNSSLPSLI